MRTNPSRSQHRRHTRPTLQRQSTNQSKLHSLKPPHLPQTKHKLRHHSQKPNTHRPHTRNTTTTHKLHIQQRSQNLQTQSKSPQQSRQDSHPKLSLINTKHSQRQLHQLQILTGQMYHSRSNTKITAPNTPNHHQPTRSHSLRPTRPIQPLQQPNTSRLRQSLRHHQRRPRTQRTFTLRPQNTQHAKRRQHTKNQTTRPTNRRLHRHKQRSSLHITTTNQASHNQQ